MVTSTPDMRQRLLDAALDVLQREGPAALTVRNITDRAGCSTTGIYTYFGGKNGLVDAIYLDGFQSFDTALQPHYQAGNLMEAGREYRRWALANPMHYMVMFGRAVPDHGPSDDASQRAAASFRALADAVAVTAAAAAEGQVDGQADDQAIDAAYHLYAAVHGYVMLELAGMGPVEAERHHDLYEKGLEQVLRGIGVPAAGHR